jgi:hypothetical protein
MNKIIAAEAHALLEGWSQDYQHLSYIKEHKNTARLLEIGLLDLSNIFYFINSYPWYVIWLVDKVADIKKIPMDDPSEEIQGRVGPLITWITRWYNDHREELEITEKK